MKKVEMMMIQIKTRQLLVQLTQFWKYYLNEKMKELVIKFALFKLKHIFKRIQIKKYGGYDKKKLNYFRQILSFKAVAIQD